MLLPSLRASLALRAGTRDARRAYSEGAAFRRAGERWSADQRRAWQLGALRAAVRRAAATTPYFRDLFRREGFDPRADFDFDDYARLPVLERDAVREAGDALIMNVLPRSALRRDATGGSTGTPTVVWRGPEDNGWSQSGSEYYLERVAGPLGSGTAFLWGHHLDPVTRDSRSKRIKDFASNLRWYDCFRLSPEVLVGYHHELDAWRPARIIAYASALAALAEAIDAIGERAQYPVYACVTGAEKLYPHQRALVRRVFAAPVYERYGGRDVGLVAFQTLPDSTDFAVDWANVVVEPDEVSDGAAGVLVTKLHADGMPLLRYRVGDLARFSTDARPGHPAHTLHEILGRDVDRLLLPGGRWVHALSFPHMLKDFPVRDFQVHQARDLSLAVRVVPTAGFDEGTSDAIRRLVTANFVGVPVRVEAVEAIPRTKANKWRPVTSDAQAAAEPTPV